ncbi:hypothetical protein [Nocardia sp. NPDC052566]|uniref:hypothetical protein n=1 Tax=Nocardia sp. NPDC052566 TaxID=3364330 RepID=UPI0037CCA5E4
MPTTMKTSPPQRIPCQYANGLPVTTSDADMIARAFGFSSAHQLEHVVAQRERINRARGIVSAAARMVAQSNAVAAQATAEHAKRTGSATAEFDYAYERLRNAGELTGEAPIDAVIVARSVERRPADKLASAS